MLATMNFKFSKGSLLDVKVLIFIGIAYTVLSMIGVLLSMYFGKVENENQ